MVGEVCGSTRTPRYLSSSTHFAGEGVLTLQVNTVTKDDGCYLSRSISDRTLSRHLVLGTVHS